MLYTHDAMRHWCVIGQSDLIIDISDMVTVCCFGPLTLSGHRRVCLHMSMVLPKGLRLSDCFTVCLSVSVSVSVCVCVCVCVCVSMCGQSFLPQHSSEHQATVWLQLSQAHKNKSYAVITVCSKR